MKRAAFTLIELLVVIAIVAVLASLVLAFAPGVILRGREAASLGNMRQIGTAFQLYANDNAFSLPSRVLGSGDRWPALLHGYMGNDVKVYADPGDPKNFLRRKLDPLSNSQNHTSYLMNGYNDLGAYDNPVVVKTNSIEKPSETILLGNQSGTSNFYMDSQDGDQNRILRKDIFNKGANYLFADGSARFIAIKDYRDDLWWVHKP